MDKLLKLKKEKQDKIINAALACFARNGYEKASINDIAVAAGISKASMFQYFGCKKALYEYLLKYCSSQMSDTYNRCSLDINVDFFDRVMEASVMKINNLKLHPHIASFIAGALAEQAADVKDTIGSMVGNGKIKAMQMVLDKTDADKFRHPEDIDRIMDTIMLLGEGMAFRLENDKDTDYDRIMAEFEDLLRMLKRNFYKEEYL